MKKFLFAVCFTLLGGVLLESSASEAKQNLNLQVGIVEPSDSHGDHPRTPVARPSVSSRNRWIWMSLNLMGDPEMPVYVEKPKTFQNVEIEIVNDSLFVDTGVENFDICMINREDSTLYYIARGVQGPSAAFGRLDGSYSVSITKPGYIPYIVEAEEVTYLQNMTLANNRSYKSPNVMIGSDVTDRIEYGPVVVETGNTTITASESVTISKDFEVKKGATFTIINQ